MKEIYVICNGNVTKVTKIEDLSQFIDCKIEITDNEFDAAVMSENQEKERKEKIRKTVTRPAY